LSPSRLTGRDDYEVSNAQHRRAGHRKPWSLGVRATSSLAAIAAFLTGAWVSLVAGIYTSAFQSPNPDPALDGDPCCGHPDTWGNVIVGGIHFAALAIVALGLLTLSFILFSSGSLFPGD
jgi:hypothetical protein